MKKNLLIICLSCLAAGLYYLFIPYSDLTVANSSLTYKDPQESAVFRFQTIGNQEIRIIPADNQSLYCLLPLSFIEKTEGFGVSAQDFLEEAGENLEGPTQKGQVLQLSQTTSMSILNYVHTPSKPLAKGKTYILLVGRKGENQKIQFTESIEIKL